MREWQSQSHVRWYCRYHVVWVPKYRKRSIFGQVRRGSGKIVRELCQRHGATALMMVPLVSRSRTYRNQRELDEDAHAFALGLIERWVADPSNVRLLRIGLDLWPDANVLKAVVDLLRPFTEKGGRRKAPRRVAWYCLAEILRAGATETGLVDDAERLPQAIDLDEYRGFLRDEAARLVGLPAAQIPWYLRQQALLYLAAFAPDAAPVVHTGRSIETRCLGAQLH